MKLFACQQLQLPSPQIQVLLLSFLVSEVMIEFFK